MYGRFKMKLMERGEFKKTVESATNYADTTLVDTASEEAFLEANRPRFILELFAQITEQASKGEKWASVTGKAHANSAKERSLLHLLIINTSHFMQMDGFQTDEAVTEADGYRYHQLTVFWADGKDKYEHELHRLRTMDDELLDQAIAV